MQLKSIVIAAALACASNAFAHELWLEPTADGHAVMRFGEFGENLRETSPGILDMFVKPSATLISQGKTQSADGKKTPTGFALPFAARAGDSIVAEDAAFPLRKFKEGDKEATVWVRPAARLVTDFSAQAPQLPLDLVPTGTPGTFKLVFNGKPQAKAKVTLTTQSGWAKEGHTDAQGVVTFDMPWQGQYVAAAMHNERTPGERAGKQGAEHYDGVTYVTTLTYVSPTGVAPIAAPTAPVAKQ